MSSDDKTRLLPNMADTSVGTQLSGIYELDERIASGGMGEVYRGHNIQTGDHVAIKIVLPEFARDQTILSLFRKEASILNHLSHDAVVRYHVFTIDPGIGRPYLAMEFVDGQSLYDVMRGGAMAAPDVRKLCHRLASGLSAVHQAGAIHRDLSPDNIILPGGRVERAKIIDFGIARSAAVGGETLIGGKFAGKYNYVSPEQLGLFGGEVSEQSDIYSLGLVLAAALRGKPIDMGGSQYEIVEKRRTVPDLSGIDADFRDIVEAMLQPDPDDRPASMAEIARLTRDDSDATLPPASLAPRPGLPRTGQTAGPVSKIGDSPAQGFGSAPPSGTAEPSFVPHVRPAHLSQPKPAAETPKRASTPPKRATTGRNLTIAVLAAVVMVSLGGLYASGIVGFGDRPRVTDTGKPLQPELTKPIVADKPLPDTAPVEKTVPKTQPAETAAEDQAKTPVEPQPTPPVASSATAPLPAAPIDKTVALQPPSGPSQSDAAKNPEPVSPPVEPKATAPATQTPEPTAQAPTPTASAPQPTAQPPEPKAQAPEPTAQAPKPDTQAPKPDTQAPETTAEPNPSRPNIASGEQADKSAEPDIAMNVPKPEVPPPADAAAERVTWVRAFNGGDCFFATVTSAADKGVAIEGFGTSVPPFEQLLGEFQAKFHVEPDISVRLIQPPQCGITGFLRFMGASTADRPQLVLDQTSVPDGSPIDGTLVTHGGLVSSVFLIDHRGIAFNLDDHVVVQADKATFSIPIGLGAADKAAGKALPQIIMVITGPQDIKAADFTTPTPASVLLPRILDEIGARSSAFSATAKYFRLGG
ncbi:serine/threonine-protein kinase [Mesorhizobium sp. LNJC405B00]|uniref:serine/threonine-protein kinase n=1 Tax=Mesorhizobium sp. LNJC405B00 TaxID=1287281 RepID=UPI0003CF2217|nr:serine/threonine-protein kinase [Mesorhizobium sp. LNJC405B00]ESY00343.1 serine/threonine protein kinase [Mesorhizobium sp. LNJC405B00]